MFYSLMLIFTLYYIVYNLTANFVNRSKCSKPCPKFIPSRDVRVFFWKEDKNKRDKFKTKLACIEPSNRVYIDESGMDSRSDYSYGWSNRGQKFEALKSGRKTGQVNMIAAYCQKQLFAPFTVEGSCNRTVFETWLEKCLILALQPGQVVIMDNATFHKGGHIQELIESSGCRLLYLPTYSPDLNRN